MVRNCDGELKCEVTRLAAYHEHRLNLGSKAIYHIEAFIAAFMAIYKKFLEDSMSAMFWRKYYILYFLDLECILFFLFFFCKWNLFKFHNKHVTSKDKIYKVCKLFFFSFLSFPYYISSYIFKEIKLKRKGKSWEMFGFWVFCEVQTLNATYKYPWTFNINV